MASTRNVDEGSVEKKFMSAKGTQESIQGISMWALNHKTQHEQIVEIWLSVLKKSKMPRRLTLFYICNEIVQTCKRRHAVVYKDQFKEILKDAALLVRDKSISNNVERIFKIWEERGVYEAEFVQELTAILNDAKVQPAATKLFSDFKPSGLRETISNFAQLEKDIDMKRRRLSTMNIDVTSNSFQKYMKDRRHGKQYTQQIEDTYKILNDIVSDTEKSMSDRVALIDQLECSELFYEAQFGEAKIVANAYRNFGTRVKNLQKKLEDTRKTLPDPLSPVPSPSMDAPSPVESLPADGTVDNTELLDMDLSEDDNAENDDDVSVVHMQEDVLVPSPVPDVSHQALLPPQVMPQRTTASPVTMPSYTITTPEVNEMFIKPFIGNASTLPSAPDNVDSPSNSPVFSDSSMNKMNFSGSFFSNVASSESTVFTSQLSRIPDGEVPTSSTFHGTARSVDDSNSAELEDDGGGTPVQDEHPSNPVKMQEFNPIELLNRLISQNKQETPNSAAFIQSLQVLTQSMRAPSDSGSGAGDGDLNKGPVNSNRVPVDNSVVPVDNRVPVESVPFKPFYNAFDYHATSTSSSVDSPVNGHSEDPYSGAAVSNFGIFNRVPTAETVSTSGVNSYDFAPHSASTPPMTDDFGYPDSRPGLNYSNPAFNDQPQLNILGSFDRTGSNYPNNSSTFREDNMLLRSDSFPPRSDSFPPRSDSFPLRSDSFPPRSDSFPPGSDSFPPRSDSFPPRSDSFPPRSDSFPAVPDLKPDVVEMLKSILNSTKQPVPSPSIHPVREVDFSLSTSSPPAYQDHPDPRAQYDPFGSPDDYPMNDRNEFVERLKQKTGFGSPMSAPLTSPKLFQQMLSTGQMHRTPGEPGSNSTFLHVKSLDFSDMSHPDRMNNRNSFDSYAFEGSDGPYPCDPNNSILNRDYNDGSDDDDNMDVRYRDAHLDPIPPPIRPPDFELHFAGPRLNEPMPFRGYPPEMPRHLGPPRPGPPHDPRMMNMQRFPQHMCPQGPPSGGRFPPPRTYFPRY